MKILTYVLDTAAFFVGLTAIMFFGIFGSLILLLLYMATMIGKKMELGC